MLPVTMSCLHPEMSLGAYFRYEIYTSVFAVQYKQVHVAQKAKTYDSFSGAAKADYHIKDAIYHQLLETFACLVAIFFNK